jgi:hypothetical protein
VKSGELFRFTCRIEFRLALVEVVSGVFSKCILDLSIWTDEVTLGIIK